MNYPIWDLPGSGLLIAFVAIVHVFISHFAVGGGLFLVLTERKALRENDAGLLDYVKRHSRFFILVTLVMGAITGVGIWFTITLVHPAATSSLINTFVWGWAIEWTFFLTEIAAAMVYYYGWGRLSPKVHLAVGWIYFAAAWLSLVVINGILSYMMTPGAWIDTRGFWDGFFNETYWPSLVLRTFACVGLAGLYALFTAATLPDPALKAKVARWAAFAWVVPMAVALPLSLLWYLAAAGAAGAPIAQTFGAASSSPLDVLLSIVRGGATTGYPFAQIAARVAFAGAAVAFVGVLLIATWRRASFGRFAAIVVMAGGFAAIGGGEWAREDARKPYVIGKYMYVNGIRVESVEGLNADGVLPASLWSRLPEGWSAAEGSESLDAEEAAGRELFRLECSACHTVDGYNAIRPLVKGQANATLETLLGRLEGWRERRMPPFVGTASEKRALGVYLARLGGGAVAPRAAAADGASLFEASCAMCHGEGSDWPIAGLLKGRDATAMYDVLGRLPELNDMMPAFEGSDEERRSLAAWLAGGAR